MPKPQRDASQVICVAIDLETGEATVQAAGRATRKESAETIARKNALRVLKKKLGGHFSLDNYEFTFKYG